MRVLILCPSTVVVMRIASMDWIDENGSSIRTIAWTDSEYQDPCSTRILVKLWDIGNDKYDRLFEATATPVAQFSHRQYLAVAVTRQSENSVELWNLEDDKITHRLHTPLEISNHSTFHPPVIV